MTGDPPTERIPGNPPTRPMAHGRPTDEPGASGGGPAPASDGPHGPDGRHSTLTVVLAAAAAFLAGVVLLVALDGSDTQTRTVTDVAVRTVTVAPPPTTTPGTVVVTTPVPDVLGERLGTAQERLERSQFDVDVVGGGLLGVIVESNWEVVRQDPPAGTQLEQGSTVEIEIARR